MANGKKKTVLVVTVVALVALLAIGATLALLTDSGTITNFLGIGKTKDGDDLIKIKLHEPLFLDQVTALRTAAGVGKEDTVGIIEWNDPTDQDQGLSKISLYKIMPGDKLAKDPEITVVGEEPVYLRMKVDATMLQAEGTDTETQDAFKVALLTASPTANPAGLGLELADDWVEGQDGFYYYVNTDGTPKIVAKTDTTPIPIFKVRGTGDSAESLTIPIGWDYDEINVFGESGLQLVVTAESTQARNFEPDLDDAEPWSDAHATYSTTIG